MAVWHKHRLQGAKLNNASVGQIVQAMRPNVDSLIRTVCKITEERNEV